MLSRKQEVGLHRDISTLENHALVDFTDVKECPRILLYSTILEGFFYGFMKSKTSLRFFFIGDSIHSLADNETCGGK